MGGSSWSVDVEGTRAVLARFDADALEFCAAGANAVLAFADASAAVAGSSTVGAALAGFHDDRSSFPSWVAARVVRAGGAVIESMEAVVGADEIMAATAAAHDQVSSTGATFSALRFGSDPR